MKIYSNGHYVLESASSVKEVLAKFKVSQEESESPSYRNAYKGLCDYIRGQLNEKNVIGFLEENDSDTVIVIVYPVLSTEDNYYTQSWENVSETEGRPYIWMEE